MNEGKLGSRSNLFTSEKKTTLIRADAIAALRLDLVKVIVVARQSGVDSYEIDNILEQHAEIWRQNDAMTRPVV